MATVSLRYTGVVAVGVRACITGPTKYYIGQSQVGGNGSRLTGVHMSRMRRFGTTADIMLQWKTARYWSDSG